MAKLYLGTQEVSKVAKKTNVQSLNVTPTISAQTITATEGTGYSPVNVSAVTSAIDSNITAGNIKKNISILGITGTYGGGESIVINREVSSTGVYQMPSSNFTFTLPSNATDLGPYVLQYAFYECYNFLNLIDLSSLVTISGAYALYYAFHSCFGLTSVDLSNLITISGDSALRYAFSDCTHLASVDLPSLATISASYGMTSAFTGCYYLSSINLSSLVTVSGSNALSNAFQSCVRLTSVNFSNLAFITGASALSFAFYGCTSLTSLSFPALTLNSFGSNTNQFNSMLYGCSNVTVHFPASIQSKIGSWSSVTSGFGGTNTTVLFDLGEQGPSGGSGN